MSTGTVIRSRWSTTWPNACLHACQVRERMRRWRRHTPSTDEPRVVGSPLGPRPLVDVPAAVGVRSGYHPLDLLADAPDHVLRPPEYGGHVLVQDLRDLVVDLTALVDIRRCPALREELVKLLVAVVGGVAAVRRPVGAGVVRRGDVRVEPV